MRRQRGLTLVELAVTIVVAGILVGPVIFVIHQIAISDSRALDRVEAVHDTRVLAAELRVLARDANMRLGIADAFEVENDERTLRIYHETGAVPPPLMATVEYDEGTGEIRITDHRDDDRVWVAIDGVTAAQFTLPNPRSFELFVEVERDQAAHIQRIRAHAPNVR